MKASLTIQVPVSKPAQYLIAGASLFGLVACNSTPVNESTACPQNRYTDLAPAAIASRQNPLPVNASNLEAGEDLYRDKASPVACVECHGNRGDGNGVMANMFEPAPRNFTCYQTMDQIPDGQIFWIIKNGSIGTSMPAFGQLSEQEIWQLTMYIRRFSEDAEISTAGR